MRDMTTAQNDQSSLIKKLQRDNKKIGESNYKLRRTVGGMQSKIRELENKLRKCNEI